MLSPLLADSYALLTRPPLRIRRSPLDLHVLSLPPAFNLSHDQTLLSQIKALKKCGILRPFLLIYFFLPEWSNGNRYIRNILNLLCFFIIINQFDN